MNKSVPIEIKDRDVFDSLIGWLFHSKLRKLFYWLNSWCENITITEGYRKALHKDDVHATKPVRAIDIRSWRLKDPQAVADKVNKHWIYDRKRPHMKCCVFHARCPQCRHDNQPPYHDLCDKCGTSIVFFWHMHLQVHPSTEFVG